MSVASARSIRRLAGAKDCAVIVHIQRGSQVADSRSEVECQVVQSNVINGAIVQAGWATITIVRLLVQ